MSDRTAEEVAAQMRQQLEEGDMNAVKETYLDAVTSGDISRADLERAYDAQS